MRIFINLKKYIISKLNIFVYCITFVKTRAKTARFKIKLAYINCKKIGFVL